MLYTFFFFNDTATTEIYTLSLHDALPISMKISVHTATGSAADVPRRTRPRSSSSWHSGSITSSRSEEHTSELQSRRDLVCRLLLEKKKKKKSKKIIQKQKYTMKTRVINSK